ncbi:MAG: NAD(P)H-dependent oxidoreductase [Eubacterium sp.]|nr:NAD(P)H-dependent oxidoreductase [Eubacterium sp.]
MTLYIECCPRTESRTRRLAKVLLDQIGEYEVLNLYDENLLPMDEKRVNRRSALNKKKAYEDPIFKYAKQFANADTIVIAAPFWDLSFPAVLKLYIENIYVTGLVSDYNENGQPVGLCKASKLYFVTTAGGPLDERFGYDYIKALAQEFFGIPEVELFKAEMLDIVGNDPEAILQEAMSRVKIK